MYVVPRGDLSEPERSLWSAFPRGAWVDVRTADPDERVIRADVVAALLLGAGDAAPGHSAAVRVRGARIVGRLDLMGGTVGCALVCEYCDFDDPLRFVEATTRTVRIVFSR